MPGLLLFAVAGFAASLVDGDWGWGSDQPAGASCWSAVWQPYVNTVPSGLLGASSVLAKSRPSCGCTFRIDSVPSVTYKAWTRSGSPRPVIQTSGNGTHMPTSSTRGFRHDK